MPSRATEDSFARPEKRKRAHITQLVEDKMTKIELVAVEETTVETAEELELSLSELDMVGGGAIGSILG
jgi:hypothetical protein